MAFVLSLTLPLICLVIIIVNNAQLYRCQTVDCVTNTKQRPHAVYLNPDDNTLNVIFDRYIFKAPQALVNGVPNLSDEMSSRIYLWTDSPDGVMYNPLTKEVWVFKDDDLNVYNSTDNTVGLRERFFDTNIFRNSTATQLTSATSTHDSEYRFMFTATGPAGENITMICDHEYDKIVDSDNYRSSLQIAYIGRQGTMFVMLVFISDIWTVLITNKIGLEQLFDNELRNNFLPTKYIWRSSSIWIGCPPEICFDGQVDAVASVDENTIHLIRGKYTWHCRLPLTTTSNEPTPTRHLYLSGSSLGFVDAAVEFGNNRLYVIVGQRIQLFRNNALEQGAASIANLIAGYPMPIDAAFRIDDKYYLISENRYSAYEIDVQSAITAVKEEENTLLINKWPGLPLEIDAATNLKDNVAFFSGNFVFLASRTRRSKVKMELIQNTLFPCQNTFYRDTAKALQLSNFQDFKTYRLGFQPPFDNTGSSSSWFLTVVIVTIVAIFVLACAGIYWQFRTTTSVHEFDDTTSDTTVTSNAAPTNPSFKSV